MGTSRVNSIINQKMDKSIICYDWIIGVAMVNKNGRKRNNHYVKVLGFDFKDAKRETKQKLKRSKCELLTINSAKAVGIAFVLADLPPNTKLSLSEHYPDVPEDLNK